MPQWLALLLLKSGIANLFSSVYRLSGTCAAAFVNTLTSNKDLHVIFSYLFYGGSSKMLLEIKKLIKILVVITAWTNNIYDHFSCCCKICSFFSKMVKFNGGDRVGLHYLFILITSRNIIMRGIFWLLGIAVNKPVSRMMYKDISGSWL